MDPNVEDFESQLLWKSWPAQQRPLDFCAPSFSWASVASPIYVRKFGHKDLADTENNLFKCKHIKLDYASENKLGALVGGHMELECQLFLLRWDHKKEVLSLRDHILDPRRIYLDAHHVFDDHTFCFPAKYEKGGTITLLLLHYLTSESKGTFRRLGVTTVDEFDEYISLPDDGRKALMERRFRTRDMYPSMIPCLKYNRRKKTHLIKII